MVPASLWRSRMWLTPICALAFVSAGVSWLVADSAIERAAFVGSVSLSAVVAVQFGLRLTQEFERRSERLLALAGIVETTGDAVVAARLDRTVTAWNSGAERLFGYTAEEMIGSSVSRIAPAGLEQSLEDHLQLMLEKDGMHTYEVKRAHKSGRLIDVSITLSPLRDDDGNVVGISSIIRDISERMRMEAQREELLVREHDARVDAEHARSLVEEQNERLLALDRMKDDFVASVSHELRTPLTSINGYLELVTDGEVGELTEEQSHFLGIVRRNAERLLRVVGDLLFVAQVNASELVLEREPVDLVALAGHAVDAVRPLAGERGIEVAFQGEPVEPVEGDAGRLGQVIDNLLTNAVKFTPPGGRVDVQLRADNGLVELDVSDTGIGISEADRAHLFERFFRTSDARVQAIQGTGLGLSIVAAIVKAHGGSVEVQSEVGVGTTFRVVLPVSKTAETVTA